MEVVRLEPPLPPARRERGADAIVAVGNFDGVHRGHQALIAAALTRARTAARPAVVLTFDPHPARVLQPERAPGSLMTMAQKAELLAALGVDLLAVLAFTPALAGEEPSAFASSVLADALRARAVVVGEEFRFGRGRAGDVQELRRLGEGLGFEVLAVPAVLEGGHPVSSTRIRESLARGEVAAARVLLGRPHFVEGPVVHGEGRGRTLGIPTANVAVENEVLPKQGVYLARAAVAGREERPAVVNLGHRPTFGGGAMTVEAHLLDFEGDLYERRLRLSFLSRLRDEQAFSGREALVAQVRADILRAREVLLGRGDAV